MQNSWNVSASPNPSSHQSVIKFTEPVQKVNQLGPQRCTHNSIPCNSVVEAGLHCHKIARLGLGRSLLPGPGLQFTLPQLVALVILDASAVATHEW